jgi:hypothetical protein
VELVGWLFIIWCIHPSFQSGPIHHPTYSSLISLFIARSQCYYI